MDQSIIRLRPHHALCLRHYVGKGYNDDFVANMSEIHARLQSGEREMVQIIMHRDSLCSPCPHQVNATCDRECWVQQIDRAVAKACGLRSGLWLPWKDLCAMLDQHIFNQEKWQELCAGCPWYDVCREVHEKQKA